jgi:putative endonuclease
MKRREVGALGESIAAAHLKRLGYTISERNFRTREGEIDIIAEKDGVLVFVEVRARRSRACGTPEESITPRKKERLISLADAYMEGRDGLPDAWRIDVVALELGRDGEVQRIDVIENATDWGM